MSFTKPIPTPSYTVAAILARALGFDRLPKTRLRSKLISIHSETGSQFFVNGKFVGNDTTIVLVRPYSRVKITLQKPGYKTLEKEYVNDEQHLLPPTEYLALERDDAHENSFAAAFVNQDRAIQSQYSEAVSWNIITQALTAHPFKIHDTDRTIGYICTDWIMKKINATTARTRLIIKTESYNPLIYQVKLVAEISSKTSAEIRNTNNFQPWNRALLPFETLLTYLENKLTKPQ